MKAYTKTKPKRAMEYYWKRNDFTQLLPTRVSRVIVLTSTLNGYYNEGYRDQIQKHQCATTELGAEYHNWYSHPASINIGFLFPFGGGGAQSLKKEEAKGDLHSSTQNFPPNIADSPNPQALNRALSDTFKQIREAHMKVSGPTFLGEARETLRMLRRPGEGIRNLAKGFLDTLKNRKRAKPKTWAKDVGAIWLEHSFGWKPLLMDARDAAAAWNALFDQERVVTFEGFGVQEDYLKNSSSTFTHSFNNYCYYLMQKSVKSVRIVRIKGQVRAKAKTGPRAQLALFGFEPSEFLPTAWELLPWSFLVDYFTNIGDIIQAGVTDTSGVMWSSMTNIQDLRMEVHGGADVDRMRSVMGYNAAGMPNLQWVEQSPGLMRFTRRRISRTRSYPLSVPNLYFTIPRSDNQLGNLAALLAQALDLHPQRGMDRFRKGRF